MYDTEEADVEIAKFFHYVDGIYEIEQNRTEITRGFLYLEVDKKNREFLTDHEALRQTLESLAFIGVKRRNLLS